RNLISTRRFRASALAGLAAAALALSGCNPGGEPNTGGTTTPSATESATPSSTASATPTPTAPYKPADATGRAQNVPVPVLPEVAKTETKEGLEAFTAYWFEQLNFAYETGDAAGIQAVTSPGCEFCSNITTSLISNYQGGRWLAGGKITVPSTTTTFEPAADGNYEVIVQVQQDTITYHDPGGAEFRTQTQPSDTGNVLLITFKDAAWHVNGLHPLRG
ncbi:MAG: hypothetical protein JWQ75_1907, partial [Pseudarthrobacter sp.]|nr:hypothetical protein [Pseudarthrobacter sp.]